MPAVAEPVPRALTPAPDAFPPPSRKDEKWRFANLKQLAAFEEMVAAPPVDPTLAASLSARSNVLADTSAKFVFANEELVANPVDRLPEGVVCLPLAVARERHPDLFAEHFMAREIELGSDRYAALHKANTRSGVFVYVPKNVVVDRPIEVFHWLGGAEHAAGFPHTLVVADTHSQVTVIDHFRSSDAAACASVGVCDLVANDGAHITYLNTQLWNDASRGIQLGSASAKRDSHITSLFLNLGGAWVRNENTSHLDGPGAHSLMLSVSVATGDQQFDQRTRQLHHAPDTTSDLLYKNALADTARTVFGGLIVVDKGAHQTDAYQTCRNLLLSDECEANAMPGLEINADGVKCSHGATSSPIDPEQLFYLKSRGITGALAGHLITLGFARNAIDRLRDPKLAEALVAMVEAKLKGA
ncbi:Fe-S cluster assembly protein SufD [soil metagenome]